MADPKQQEALFEDDAASPATPASPYPLLDRFPHSKALSTAHTRAGYSQVPGQYSAHPSPAHRSPEWSSPGLEDGFDDVRIHDLQGMREKDTVSRKSPYPPA
jgi:hypothetical protein